MRGLIAVPRGAYSESIAHAAVAAARAASGDSGMRPEAERRRKAAAICREIFPHDHRALGIITRAAVDPLDTSDVSALIETPLGQFLSSLEQSAGSSIIAQAIRTGLDANGHIRVPSRSNAAAAMPWVGEGSPIPVRAGALTRVEVDPKKFGAISVISREVARRTAGAAVIEALLKEDAAKSLDAAMFATSAGSDTAVAGLLYGVSPIDPDTGTGRDAMLADLANLASAVGALGSGTVIFVASPDRAARVQFRAPDLQITMLGSTAVPADRVIAVDPSSLIFSFDGSPDVTASSESVVHMDDEPAEIVSSTGPTVAAPVRSLWQTDCVAIRLLADVAFARRRSGAVAYVDGVEPHYW